MTTGAMRQRVASSGGPSPLRALSPADGVAV